MWGAYRFSFVILLYFPVLPSLLTLSHICIVNCPRLLLLVLLLLLEKFNFSFLLEFMVVHGRVSRGKPSTYYYSFRR